MHAALPHGRGRGRSHQVMSAKDAVGFHLQGPESRSKSSKIRNEYRAILVEDRSNLKLEPGRELDLCHITPLAISVESIQLRSHGEVVQYPRRPKSEKEQKPTLTL